MYAVCRRQLPQASENCCLAEAASQGCQSTDASWVSEQETCHVQQPHMLHVEEAAIQDARQPQRSSSDWLQFLLDLHKSATFQTRLRGYDVLVAGCGAQSHPGLPVAEVIICTAASAASSTSQCHLITSSLVWTPTAPSGWAPIWVKQRAHA